MEPTHAKPAKPKSPRSTTKRRSGELSPRAGAVSPRTGAVSPRRTLRDVLGHHNVPGRAVTWRKVTSVEVSPGGASGRVATFRFGRESKVVKAGQFNAAEVVVAATLINDMEFASGKFRIRAPMTFIADDAERADIRAALRRKDIMVGDPRNFPTALEADAPVVVADEMSGVTVRKLLTQKTFKNGRIRPDSVLAVLMTQPDAMAVLGKATAADIVMGNGDRLAEAINLENFMFNAKTRTFNYVDNTNKASAGYLTENTTRDRGEQRTTTAEGAFVAWTEKHFVGTVHGAADRRTAARDVAESVIGRFTSDSDGVWFELNAAKRDRMDNATVEQRPTIQQEFEEQVKLVRAATTGAVVRNMTESFAQGLDEGLDLVVARLNSPGAVDALVGALPDQRQQYDARVSLRARARFLTGEAAADAWAQAVRDVPLPRELRPPPPNRQPALAVERVPQKPLPATPPDSPPESPRDAEPAAAVDGVPE